MYLRYNTNTYELIPSVKQKEKTRAEAPFMSSYNAVPPPGAPAVGSSSADALEDVALTGPLTAQQRLAALKAKLKDARTKNHKEVVEEDRRNKLGPEALRKERAKRAYDKAKAAGTLMSDEDKARHITAEDAYEKLTKQERKEKRRAESGWDVYNNEAQYRNYKKQTRRQVDVGRMGGAGADEEQIGVAEDPDPLDYGQAPPVAKARVQARVDDMHEAALRRASWSRRRPFDEARDVTDINKRNEVYNKKIERAFDPYTSEIKANLERGTAL